MAAEPISPLTFRIRVAMLRTGVGTYDRLSVKTNIERSRLSRIANGYIVPRPDEQRAIADALGLDVAEVFGAAAVVEEPQR